MRAVRTLGAAVLAGAISVAVATPSSGRDERPHSATVRVTAGRRRVEHHFGARARGRTSSRPRARSINLNYVKHGSFLGRQDLIAKNVDFAISGVPFTPDELSHVKGGASAFIDAPIQVATLATFVEPPSGGFQAIVTRCDPDDPTTWPPDVTDGSSQCIVKTPYKGAVRIPSQNLGAMFLHYPFGAFPPLAPGTTPTSCRRSAWMRSRPAARLPRRGTPAGRIPTRSTTTCRRSSRPPRPTCGRATSRPIPTVPWEPITERLGQVVGRHPRRCRATARPTRAGRMRDDGPCANDVAGGVAPAPPSMVKQFRQAFPKQPVDLAELQNANGDWVAPTADAINKAVDAGGDSPLYALTHKVPGAYPLVWVDHLYAPAHGLSIEKTEGLAMTIRYLATTGQEKENATGEGRLSAALVAKALAAADKLVSSNCTGADRRIVTSSDPGPLAPPTATAMRAIGPMLHCEAVRRRRRHRRLRADDNDDDGRSGAVRRGPTTLTPSGSSFATVAGRNRRDGSDGRIGSTPTTVAAGLVECNPDDERVAHRFAFGVTDREQAAACRNPGARAAPIDSRPSCSERCCTSSLRKPVGRLARRIAT